MDILVKDEPLGLEFNLKEQFKSNDPKNDAVIGEISALVKEAQIFLQESEYEMKNMQDCFEKMKKRHTENIIITFKILQLLTTYNVLPVAINQDNVTDEFVKPPLEIIDNERSPDTISVESANTKSQTDKAEIMEFSVSERPSIYISKNDTDEISENNQKKLEYKNLSSKGQATKHSLPGETCNFQLDDEVGSAMIDVDVVSADSRTENYINKTSNTDSIRSPASQNKHVNSQNNKMKTQEENPYQDNDRVNPSKKDPLESDDMFGDSDDNISSKENTGRQKKKCPYCDKLLCNLPRHLRNVHYLDPSDAKRISYCKRKRKISSSDKRRPCPLPECKFSQPFVRLDNHLKTKHSLNSTDELYLSICKGKSKTDSLKNEIKNLIKYSPFSLKESEIFVAFLQRLYGGKKGQKNARSQGFKLRKIINEVGATSVTDYCMPQTGKKFQKFIEHFGKDHNPNSTVTYLSVLLSYLQFIIMRNFNADESKVPSVNLTLVPSRDVCKLEGVNIQIIKNLIVRVRNWRKAYRKGVSASTDFIDIPAEHFKDLKNQLWFAM